MNPFTKLKYVLTSKELLDVAFARASKITLPKSKKPPHIRARTKEIAKLKKVEDNLTTRLEDIVQRFPNFDEIHPFYRSLADTVVTIDEIRQALASVSSAIRIIKEIIRESTRKLKRVKTPDEARRLRAAAYGRISSVINRLEPRLVIIQRAANEYRRFPSINLNLPVIVVAGYPNVGKSSLVALISSATPEVAEYPFTTKKISVGHIPINSFEGQILDVPGLLDRPMKKRNPIEQRAIAAIQYLADVICFLVDPTLNCGYELNSQVSLLHEITSTFPDLEIFPILNKGDIATKGEITTALDIINLGNIPKISTLTEEGVEQVFHDIISHSKMIQKKLKNLHAQSL
ncbi:MAG: NOG1 family protein [Candidatus Thorarchaeota archaeon]